MQLTEFLTSLSYGELSNLSLSGEGSGTIVPAKLPKIISYMNDGLLRLYSRFNLREGEVIIQAYNHIQNYHFLEQFALSRFPGAGEAYAYILDSAGDPFKEDVIKVMSCHNVWGVKMPLNDPNEKYSLFTRQHNTLQIPDASWVDKVSVLYQAAHPKLSAEDIEDQRVELPLCLQGALSAWVAHKVYSHMNTPEAGAKAGEYLGMFSSICDEAVGADLVQEGLSFTNTRFQQNGWR
jgi:hypothetical protein